MLLVPGQFSHPPKYQNCLYYILAYWHRGGGCGGGGDGSLPTPCTLGKSCLSLRTKTTWLEEGVERKKSRRRRRKRRRIFFLKLVFFSQERRSLLTTTTSTTTPCLSLFLCSTICLPSFSLCVSAFSLAIYQNPSRSSSRRRSRVGVWV